MGAFPAILSESEGSIFPANKAGVVPHGLASVLEEHPTAWVGAIGTDTRYVAMPPGAAYVGHRVLEGRWPLDLVSASDRPACAKAWRQLNNGDVVGLSVHLVTGDPATFVLFGLTELYGADILVVVADHDTDIAAAVYQPLAPVARFCRVLRDEAGRIIELDRAAPVVLGWTAEVLLGGDPPLNRVHVDDHGRVLDNWISTLADTGHGHRCRARILRSDGSWRWLEITHFNQLNDIDNPCVVSEMLDVSDEMAAHEAVRAREQLLHRLAEALPLGVLQIAHDRRIVYTNERLKEILGNPTATTADEQFATTVAADRPRLHTAIADALEHGSDHDLTVRVRCGGPASERLAQVVLRSLRHDDGTVSGVIACVTDVTETTRLSRDLERRATFDFLTGCYNRASILELLEAALASSPNESGTASIFVDLDGLKAVNDDRGHAVGDDLLKRAADDMRRATRAGDLVGRLGGDEFLIVCRDTSSAAAVQVAERVAAILGRDRGNESGQVQLRASIGVGWAAKSTIGPDEVVARADAAMYISKRGGLGVPYLWTPPIGSKPNSQGPTS